MNELILLEEEQARRALEEERMRMEEHARQREQMIGGPPRGGGAVCVSLGVVQCVLVCRSGWVIRYRREMNVITLLQRKPNLVIFYEKAYSF